MQSMSLRFSESVRVISTESRRLGLTVPVFRSAPSLPDADRTFRRARGGDVVVAVRLTGRPLAAVQADLIEGLILVNAVGEGAGPTAGAVRRDLWNALARAGQVEGPPSLVAA